MADKNLSLLDCTLRDGGYVNDWNWGFHSARAVVQALVKAKVDVVEVGFLRNVEGYNQDVTVCNRIEELNKLLPSECGDTTFSCMAMRSNYDVAKLSNYSGHGIEMIRVTAHEYDIKEGMDFAKEVKNKGYKLSINPINIMGYSDRDILWIIDQVNSIQPYQFSIVDTFGAMKRRDLDRIVRLVDNNLDRSIRVALHLHDNMSLSCSLAQEFVDMHLDRPVAIDGSLMGMGRIPGNLPIELIADYLNEYLDKAYDIDYMMDAIQDYIAPIKGEQKWGYTPAYFLSAKFNLHRNYAEHFLDKGDLTNRDINHILSRIDAGKRAVFDRDYADKLYDEYKGHIVDDSQAKETLKKELVSQKDVLLLAPGATLVSHRADIIDFIKEKNPLVIGINFVTDDFDLDYAFFSNNKRYDNFSNFVCKTIVTSNIGDSKADFVIDYNGLSGAFKHGYNSMIMLIKLLNELGIQKLFIAGADGYQEGANNYYSSIMTNKNNRGNEYNLEIKKAIHNIGIDVEFITPSAYEDGR